MKSHEELSTLVRDAAWAFPVLFENSERVIVAFDAVFLHLPEAQNFPRVNGGMFIVMTDDALEVFKPSLIEIQQLGAVVEYIFSDNPEYTSYATRVSRPTMHEALFAREKFLDWHRSSNGRALR